MGVCKPCYLKLTIMEPGLMPAQPGGKLSEAGSEAQWQIEPIFASVPSASELFPSSYVICLNFYMNNVWLYHVDLRKHPNLLLGRLPHGEGKKEGRGGRRRAGREERSCHLFMPLFKSFIKCVLQPNRTMCTKHWLKLNKSGWSSVVCQIKVRCPVEGWGVQHIQGMCFSDCTLSQCHTRQPVSLDISLWRPPKPLLCAYW